MCSRLVLFAGVIWAFLSASQATQVLQFSQGTFVKEGSAYGTFPGAQHGDTTVELFGIDADTDSFRLTLSGSIANGFIEQNDGSQFLTFFPAVSYWLQSISGDIVGATVLSFAIPMGSGSLPMFDGIDAPIGAHSYVPGIDYAELSIGFPTELSPFEWSATYEIATTALVGD